MLRRHDAADGHGVSDLWGQRFRGSDGVWGPAEHGCPLRPAPRCVVSGHDADEYERIAASWSAGPRAGRRTRTYGTGAVWQEGTSLCSSMPATEQPAYIVAARVALSWAIAG